MKKDLTFIKMLLLRFARGFVAGAISAMAMINLTSVNTFTDLKTFLLALGYAAIVGGISGALLTADKFLRIK